MANPIKIPARNSTRAAPAVRRASTGAWLMIVVLMLFAALALLRNLG